MNPTIHVIGATGRTGAVLCRLLQDRGYTVVPVVRDPARWARLNLAGAPRSADLSDAETLAAALRDATHVANVGHAVWAGRVVQAAPAGARLVLLGSARRYGQLDNPPAQQAAEGERALLASGRDAVMLHPTMIYGAPEDGTVSRLATLIRRLPVLPLPAGGNQLVQPIHVADLAAAMLAALERRWAVPAAIAVGGAEPVAYAALIRAVARAAGLRAPLIVPVPAALVRLAGRGRPALLRLLADRTIDTAPMRTLLGVDPRPLERGLAEMFRKA
jgi:nucleoside-diphosphate-sugar epimerase